MAQKEAPGELVVATNRKARASYTIEDTLEAGLALLGSEVKSLRAGSVQMADAFAQPRGGAVPSLAAHRPVRSGGGLPP